MLKHIVLFKLKSENLVSDTKKAKELLESLTSTIPELVSMSVLINDTNINPDNFTFSLTSEFKNETDLKIYATHPEHLKVVSFLKPLIVARACIDGI